MWPWGELYGHQMGMLPGGHCWGYYPGTLSFSQVTQTYFYIGYPYMKSKGIGFSKGLQFGTGRQGPALLMLKGF